MAFKWAVTDERPTGKRAASTEVSEERAEILEAFRSSIKLGEEIKGLHTGAPIRIVVPDIDGVNELKKLVGWAAKQEETGYRFRFSEDQSGGLAVVFWSQENAEKLYVECPECGQTVQVTENKTVRVHGPKDDRCAGSNMEVDVQ